MVHALPKWCEMSRVEGAFSQRAMLSAAQLVRAYTESVDGDVAADVDTILAGVGEDEAELRDLIAAIAGLAGHAVMVIATRLDADSGVEEDLERRLERVKELREEVLVECIGAARDFRPAALHLPLPTTSAGMRGIWDRRSGSERRIGSDRRREAPGGSSEKINLRLFGERRLGVGNRRKGTDRRQLAAG